MRKYRSAHTAEYRSGLRCPLRSVLLRQAAEVSTGDPHRKAEYRFPGARRETKKDARKSERLFLSAKTGGSQRA